MIGLSLAVAFAKARWWLAADKAFRENKRTGGISEKTMLEVEEAERRYNELLQTKRDRSV
jgi:hypothetical protein